MKAILEFDLDDPMDRYSHRRAIKATEAYIAINAIGEKLRQLDKYSDSEVVNISELRKGYWEILEEYGINLDDLE